MPKCSICTNPKVKAINSAIHAGGSLRNVAQQFGVHYNSVGRHVENCLKCTLGAILTKHRTKQAVDIYKEFEENLAFATELRKAAQEWLTVDGKIDLDPRANEVMVVYLDHTLTAGNGKPTQSKMKLDELLEMAQTEAREPTFAIVKTLDLRKFALDAIDKVDTCIDKFAKIGGAYKTGDQDESAIQRVVRAYHMVTQLLNLTNEEREQWLKTFATEAGVDYTALSKHVEIQEIAEAIG